MPRSSSSSPRRRRSAAAASDAAAGAAAQPQSSGPAEAHPVPPPAILPLAGGGLPTAAMLMRAPLEWLVEGLIPRGRLTLVAGDTGAGKTALYTSIIGHVAGGLPLDGSARRPKATCLVYMPEDDWEGRMLDSLALVGADLDRVAIGHQVAGRPPAPMPHLPDRAAALRQRVEACRAALVIIDPLTCYLSPGISPRDETGVRAVLMCLLDLCRDTGVTCLATCHLRKGAMGSILDRISGSREWSQVPRHILTLGRNPRDPTMRVIAATKCSSGRSGAPRAYTLAVEGLGCMMRLGQAETLTHDDLAAAPETETDRDARAEAKAFLRLSLDIERARTVDLIRRAKECGISERTLRRAKLDLGIDKQLVSQDGGVHWYWVRPLKWPDQQ